MTYQLVAVVGLSLLLAGCSSFPEPDKTNLAKAKLLCHATFQPTSESSFELNPTVDGKTFAVPFTLRQNIQGDVGVYSAILGEQLCKISYLSSDSSNTHPEQTWIQYLQKSFDAWSALDPNDSIAQQREKLETARLASLASIDKIDNPTMEPIDFKLFNAAIPDKNYLLIKEFDFTIPVIFKITTTDAGANISAHLKPGEFSPQLRPALQNIRGIVAMYALKKVSSRDSLRMLVNDIYRVQYERIGSGK